MSEGDSPLPGGLPVAEGREDERFTDHMRDLLYVRRDQSFEQRIKVEPHEILASVRSLGWTPPSPSLPVADPRDLAVEIVDTIHGYTVEHAPDPSEHRREYDYVEAILVEESAPPSLPVADVAAVVRRLADGWKPSVLGNRFWYFPPDLARGRNTSKALSPGERAVFDAIDRLHAITREGDGVVRLLDDEDEVLG